MHPELTARWDALLCSINDRLAGGEGMSVPPLTLDYLDDVLDVCADEAEEMDELLEEANSERHANDAGEW